MEKHTEDSQIQHFNDRSKRDLIELLAEKRAPGRIQKIQHALQNRTNHLTVVLEDIFQSQNASAVLRSCECFGIQTVHVIENDKRFRISNQIAMGSPKWLDIVRHEYTGHEDNTAPCLQSLKARGYLTAAATLRPEAPLLNEISIDKPLAIMIGHEKKGLSQVAHEEADLWFRLPMYGMTQSYNLSVFSALCLYDLTQRLRASDIDWKLTEKERLDIEFAWMRNESKESECIIRDYLKNADTGLSLT